MTAHAVNGFAVLRFALALRVTAQALHGNASLSGRGTSRPALRAGFDRLRRLEQGTTRSEDMSYPTATKAGGLKRRPQGRSAINGHAIRSNGKTRAAKAGSM